MKTRDAKRLSSFLVSRRGAGVDIWRYLEDNNFVLRWSNSRRFYRCTFVLDRVKYLRCHRCVWRLAKIVYAMAATRHSDFEGTLVNQQQQKALGIISAVKAQLNPAYPVRAAPNYGKPHMLTTKKTDRSVQDDIACAIEREYGREMVDKVKNQWVHSSEVKDPNLIAPGFNKLALKPPHPYNRDVAAMLLLQAIVRQKQQYGPAKHEVDLTPKRLASCDANQGSAAGIIPVKPVPGIMGRLTGKKGTMHTSAYAVNLANRLNDSIPRSIPYKVFLKGEVIKKGKPVRGIQNESLASYEILHLSEPERQEVRLGNAIGMGGSNKTFASIFVVWYVVYQEETGKSWHDFVEFLADSGAHESDKVGWEASTNMTDCLPRLIVLLNEKKFKTPDCKKLYVAAVTDSHFPFVYLHKEQFQCPARVPSGTYFTSKGNTARHRSMNDYGCNYVYQHENKLGLKGCKCYGCELMRGHEAFGTSISSLLLKLRRKAFILGDDYLSVSWGIVCDDFFDTLMDRTFGTETKTEKKAFFDDAEFLRKSFKRGEENTITWYRKPERVLAKIYHGDFLCSPQRFAEALTSYKYEAGDNPKLIDCIVRMYASIDEDLLEPLDMKRFAIKRPALESVTHFHQFCHADLVNQQLQLATTIENVLIEGKF
uniref:Putative RNA dependent RNA polymerase n=1 Tax=Dongxihu virus TaxID=2656653 RepID=A0A5P8PQ30_9VIRU|nr:MAG: putative RNA dependent RNA polymerase [Dongxihu virus]